MPPLTGLCNSNTEIADCCPMVCDAFLSSFLPDLHHSRQQADSQDGRHSECLGA